MEKIRPDLFRLKIPLTDNPLGFLNSYLIKSPERNLLIDTGLRHEHCLKAMEDYLAGLRVDMAETDILLTHFHPDHGGLAPFIATPTTRIFIGAVELDTLQADLSYQYLIDFMLHKGVPSDQVPDHFLYSKFQNYLADFMDQMVLIRDGDDLAINDYQFQMIMTPGHTDGHICLYEPSERILIAGDHILSGITPGVQCIYDRSNPLGDYYQSLNKIDGLEVGLTLPGHREPIMDLRQRVAEISQHHDDRIDEMLGILEQGPLNAYDLASQMEWQMSGHQWENTEKLQRWFATSETIAHLRYAEEKGLVERKDTGSGDIFSLR